MLQDGAVRRPLYVRAAHDLRTRIEAGQFGEVLPSQDELCAILGVSRSTVREAVRILERQGILSPRQGVGTVVHAQSPLFRPGIEELFGTTELIRRSGYTPGTGWMDVRRVRAGRNLFAVFEGRTVVVLERVRTADGKPFVLSTDVFPDRGWSVDELKQRFAAGSLVEFMDQVGMFVSYSEAEITAESADALLAERLDLLPGAPLLLMESIGYGAGGEPVIYSQDFYRTDRIHFRLVRRVGV